MAIFVRVDEASWLFTSNSEGGFQSQIREQRGGQLNFHNHHSDFLFSGWVYISFNEIQASMFRDQQHFQLQKEQKNLHKKIRMLHLSFLQVLVATLSIYMAMAQSDECRCRVKRPSDKPFLCADGVRPRRNQQVYARHSDDGRRLYGDCLPEVPVK